MGQTIPHSVVLPDASNGVTVGGALTVALGSGMVAVIESPAEDVTVTDDNDVEV